MKDSREDKVALQPTTSQIRKTRDVVRWYLDLYYGTVFDLGTIPMFCDYALVGHFAVELEQIKQADPETLFKLLITVAMFQRLRDSHVLGILRSVSLVDTRELTNLDTLIYLTQSCRCINAKTNDSLIQLCDLNKDSATKQGSCSTASEYPCYLKRHTELLRRYGHFGKVPTSAALVISEYGDLEGLRVKIFSDTPDPSERATLLCEALSKTWRVSHKISAMYLALLTVPNMGIDNPPWMEGVDWRHFVVIDRNVDAFLASIQYSGQGSYSARRSFIQRLATEVPLNAYRGALAENNPRLVQQAMYLYMSESNRRMNPADKFTTMD